VSHFAIGGPADLYCGVPRVSSRDVHPPFVSDICRFLVALMRADGGVAPLGAVVFPIVG
jgi:hypothetical protein